MKKTFMQFLAEKKSKAEDFEEKFKNVDCKSATLTTEEKEYCTNKELIAFITTAYAGNN